MGDPDMGVGGAFAPWDRELKARAETHSLPKIERQCAHFKEGSDGLPYDGELYLKVLQLMKGSAAARLARRVGAVLLVRRTEGPGVVVRRLRGRGGAWGRGVNRLTVEKPRCHKASRPITKLPPALPHFNLMTCQRGRLCSAVHSRSSRRRYSTTSADSSSSQICEVNSRVSMGAVNVNPRPAGER